MIVNLKQFQFNIEYLNGYNFFYYLKINYIFILYIYILELYISLPPYPLLLEFLRHHPGKDLFMKHVT